MGESYKEIRIELEEAIAAIAACETELGSEEENIQPIHLLAEGLHSPFCLVVLGEKGAGKSFLLNGFIRHELSRTGFMEDRIRVYRHGRTESDHLIAEDLEECCRPLDFLKRFTLIDTPANLLLGDARLLTRDIFPIADLVLCVFSVNNPWAPSTWEFLRNVKKEWLSKVGFVVQQADLCEDGVAESVSKSLASHAQECLGVTPALFAISAKKAMQDDEGRAQSGIEALEKYIDEKTAASQAHYAKALATCQAARGAVIDLAERVRGTLYLVGLEATKVKDLKEIIDSCKQRAIQEVRQITQLLADSYNRSQTHGEGVLKAKLSLIQTLKSAIHTSGDFSLPFEDALEKQAQSEIANAAEAIKADLLDGSQQFLESTIFPQEEDQVIATETLAKNGRELADQVKRILSRNRTEGVEGVLHDLLDGVGKSLRIPALATLAGVFITLGSYRYPTILGISAAATAISMAVMLMLISQKHKLILSDFHSQIAQQREKTLSTIERQLREAIDVFCNKHLALLPQTTFTKSARQRLDPFLPRIESLEDTFAKLDSKLVKLLAEAQ